MSTGPTQHGAWCRDRAGSEHRSPSHHRPLLHSAPPLPQQPGSDRGEHGVLGQERGPASTRSLRHRTAVGRGRLLGRGTFFSPAKSKAFLPLLLGLDAEHLAHPLKEAAGWRGTGPPTCSQPASLPAALCRTGAGPTQALGLLADLPSRRPPHSPRCRATDLSPGGPSR